MNYKSTALLFALTLFNVGCNKINVSFSDALTSSSAMSPKVEQVEVANDQLILTGKNMNGVKELKIPGDSHVFKIVSRTATQIVYAVEGSVALNLNTLSNLVVSSAHANTNVPIAVSLCAVRLGGKEIDCSIVPTNNQVLAYDQITDKWKPATIAGGLSLEINETEPYACDESKIGSVELDPNGALCSCSRSTGAGLAWRSFEGVCTFEKIKTCPASLNAAVAADKNLHTTYSCVCDPTDLSGGNTIYGSIIYSERSSICQAAAYEGRIIDASTGGTIYYSVLRGRESYVSDSNGSVTTLADTARSSSFSFLSFDGNTKYACSESAYDGNSSGCYGAGYYYQGSGMYGNCYRLYDQNQTPPCSNWELINNNVM